MPRTYAEAIEALREMNKAAGISEICRICGRRSEPGEGIPHTDICSGDIELHLFIRFRDRIARMLDRRTE